MIKNWRYHTFRSRCDYNFGQCTMKLSSHWKEQQFTHSNAQYNLQILHKGRKTLVVKHLSCDKTTFSDSLKRYVRIRKDMNEVERFHCGLCDFKTDRCGYLKRHLIHNDLEEVQHFACDICVFKA